MPRRPQGDPRETYCSRMLDLIRTLDRVRETLGTTDVPEDVRWGHIGDVEGLLEQARELSDRVHHEGEYSPE